MEEMAEAEEGVQDINAHIVIICHFVAVCHFADNLVSSLVSEQVINEVRLSYRTNPVHTFTYFATFAFFFVIMWAYLYVDNQDLHSL